MHLDTPRLTLRPPAEQDWPAYRAYRQCARSTVTVDEHNARQMFAAFFDHWTHLGFGRFIAVERTTGAALGHFGPFRPPGHPEPELTWTLWDAAHEGRGLATEAARAARDHAFHALGWATAVSYIDPGNDRSQALAHRLGATRDYTAATPHDGVQVWRHTPGAPA